MSKILVAFRNFFAKEHKNILESEEKFRWEGTFQKSNWVFREEEKVRPKTAVRNKSKNL